MKNTFKHVLAPATAALVLLALAGCASSTAHTASSSTATSHGTDAPAGGASAGAVGTSAANSPEQVLAAWVSDVIEGDYKAACTEMAVSANGTTTGTPVPATSALCTKTTTTGSVTTSPESIIKDLHPSFTPKSLSGQPSVKVEPLSATGSSVTVDSKQINIDGTPLNQVIAANSTGVTADQLKVTFSLTRLNGNWYVSNFDLNI